ncbi:hypothetical protein AERO8C_120360 [Aeromonas veronii]|uniref:Uncharacterized protein n=1 Tax=Aeromonas veronii TaxID=654 RepID=A0A653KT11_AERVE|nr:hypothetical protein AERO8C_120360 [Aeromonas veronii]
MSCGCWRYASSGVCPPSTTSTRPTEYASFWRGGLDCEQQKSARAALFSWTFCDSINPFRAEEGRLVGDKADLDVLPFPAPEAAGGAQRIVTTLRLAQNGAGLGVTHPHLQLVVIFTVELAATGQQQGDQAANHYLFHRYLLSGGKSLAACHPLYQLRTGPVSR